jgi:hypothetical protein
MLAQSYRLQRVVHGILSGVDSWERNIIPFPACVIVAKLYPVNCIPLDGLAMLDFKQNMTREDLNVSLIMTTLQQLYKCSLNLMCFFGKAISS